MATINEIGRLKGGKVANEQSDQHTFVFDSIILGGLAGTTFSQAILDNLVSQQDGSQVTGWGAVAAGATHTDGHAHDERYRTKGELSDVTASPGASLIGTDGTFGWLSIAPGSDDVNAVLKALDSAINSGITSEYDENVFRVTKNGDATSKLRFDLTAITAGQVRSIIMPDQDINLGNITTTDYVDNALSLAMAGLNVKNSCKFATTFNTWQANNTIHTVSVFGNGTSVHNEYITIYDRDATGFDWVFYFNNTGGAITPPATGTTGTFEVAVLPGDTASDIVGKLKTVIDANISGTFTTGAFPSTYVINTDSISLSNNVNGLTSVVADSSDLGEISAGEVTSIVRNGFDGVSYAFISDQLQVTNMVPGGAAPILDGLVELDVNDRVLIKDFSGTPDAFYNGIWKVVSIDSTSAVTFERTEDADGLGGSPSGPVSNEVEKGIYTFVSTGDENQGRGYVLISDNPISVNSSELVWTQFKADKTFSGSKYIYLSTLDEIVLAPLRPNTLIVGDVIAEAQDCDTSLGTSHVLASDSLGLTIKDGVVTDAMIASGSSLEEASTFFSNTDITGAQAETLSDGSNADALHIHSSTNITEGSKLFFTEARVRSTLLTGLNLGTSGDIAATDSVLVAFGKLQNSLTSAAGAAITDLTGEATGTGPGSTAVTLNNAAVIGKVLTGYTAGAGTVAATDTILQAIQKVDGNVGALDTDDVTEGTNLYYTQGRFDTAFTAKDTDDLSEGAANFYYTEGRFDTSFGTKSTTDLSEGTNLYYTSGRFDTDLATKDTDDLAEGTNLYYTDTRFDTRLGTKDTDDLAESATKKYLTTAAQTITGIKTFDDATRVSITSVGALAIDWDTSNIFEKDISANSTFTFSNDTTGQTIIVKITNTTGGAVEANFPGAVQWQGGTAINSVPANTSNIYTFVKVGTNIYASVIDDLS